MTCQDASRVLAPYLNEVERREIFEFPTIYYFNQNERHKNKGKEA